MNYSDIISYLMDKKIPYEMARKLADLISIKQEEIYKFAVHFYPDSHNENELAELLEIVVELYKTDSENCLATLERLLI